MSLDGNLREELKCLINKAISLENRANQGKPVRYWYPLSMATYGADEILESLDSMCAFRTSMWEKTLDFERRFSTYLGCFDSVMVNSGSSADLLMAYLLTNPRRPHLKAGDEILIPIVTWPTHVWSAMMAGLRCCPPAEERETGRETQPAIANRLRVPKLWCQTASAHFEHEHELARREYGVPS